MLLVVPGIYLMIVYQITLPLVIEKGMKAWDAMEHSRKIITANFLPVLIVNLVMVTIVWISAGPIAILWPLVLISIVFPNVFIPLIWSIPFAFIVFGVTHRRLTA